MRLFENLLYLGANSRCLVAAVVPEGGGWAVLGGGYKQVIRHSKTHTNKCQRLQVN